MLIDYEDVLSNLNEKSRKALISRAEQIVLDRELDRLTEEIMATRQALKLENADKQFLYNRAGCLATRLESIKNKRKSLGDFGNKLRIERLVGATEKLSHRRLKIPAEPGEDRNSTPLNIHDLSKMDGSDLKQYLEQEIEALERCIGSIDNAIRELRNKETELRARYDINSLSRSRYVAQRDDIRRETEILETCVELARHSLAQAKHVLS